MEFSTLQSENKLQTMCQTKPIENLRLILQLAILQKDQGID